jgi:signal transduction histidine kinase/CHASE3 domain sensor protein
MTTPADPTGRARPKRTLTRQLTIAGVMLGLLQVAIFALLIGAVRSADHANQRGNEILGAVQSISDLEQTVIDSETGMRGFVITGRDAFLDPTNEARRALPEDERVARARIADEEERALFDPLVADIDAYMTRWIDAVVAARHRSAAEARRIVAAGAGKRRVDDIRAELAAIRAGLRADAARSRASAHASVRRAVVAAVVGLLLSAVLYTLYSIYVGRAIVIPVRRVASTARRMAAGDRAARVRGAETARGELGEMARSYNVMAEALEQSHDELDAQRGELHSYAEELEAQRGELERTIAALDAEKTRVEMTSVFGEAVAAEVGFAPLASLILNGVADAVRCEAGALYVRDARRGGDLALAVARGVEASDLPDIVLPGDGLAGRAAVELRPVTGTHPAGALKLQTLRGAATVAHELHVPLLQAGEVFGVLSLGRLGDVPFAEADIVLVSHLADQSGVALSKAVVLRELRRRDTITRAVLDAAPNAIALLDDGGHPVVANEPMRECLPLLRERPVPEVDDDVIRDEIEDPQTGRIFTRYVARLDEFEVGLHGRIVVLSDVTARREAERMKEEFSALVSHELRTPLTSIIGYLELLNDEAQRDRDDPAAQQRIRFLGVVDRNARRLLRLVGDLLFVAQVEAGKLSLEETDVDLEAVAKESAEAAAPRARAAGVEITLDCEPVPLVRGDRDRLAQALDNLVSNAIKFTPEGGRVVVRLMQEGDQAVLEVADTGIGISHADLERLFQRFFRTQRATSAAIPGFGLGLTIAQAIVHAHDGRISVQSRDGEGTTFRIELPLLRPAEVTA